MYYYASTVRSGAIEHQYGLSESIVLRMQIKSRQLQKLSKIVKTSLALSVSMHSPLYRKEKDFGCNLLLPTVRR
jgi:hypothetical protein